MDSGYGNWFTSNKDINNETAKICLNLKIFLKKIIKSCKY